MEKFKYGIRNFLNTKPFEFSMLGLIVINTVLMVLQSEQALNMHYSYVFNLAEKLLIGIFTVEYILRVLTVENFKKIFTPLMLIDFFAVVPFYIFYSVGFNSSQIRILRLFRLFQLFKVSRYSKAIQNIKNIFIYKKEELLIILMFLALGIIFFSTIIYHAECEVNENFSSITKSCWWTIITFTTVGYGDVTPITSIGKIIGSITALLGVSIHGLLVAILASGFFDTVLKPLETEKNEEKISVNR